MEVWVCVHWMGNGHRDSEVFVPKITCVSEEQFCERFLGCTHNYATEGHDEIV